MAIVKLKNSSVVNKVPLTTDLAYGELALNYADGKLYYKKSNGTTIDYFQSGVSSIPSAVGNSGKFLTNDGTSISWGSLSSSQVTTALGFTPLSNATSYLPLAGGTLTGVLASTKPINLANATYSTQAVLVGNWSGAGWWGLGSESGHIIKLDQVTAADTSAPTWAGATDITLKLGTKTVLDSGNYNSYSPSLTGSGASGTWGISVTGTAGSVIIDNTITYGRSGLQFVQVSGIGGTNPTLTQAPDGNWWHIIRANHGNSAGYYTDLALPFTSDGGVQYRRISNGVNNGWYLLLDSHNYSSYALPLSGGTLSGALTVTGAITASGNVTAYSDESLKKDWAPVASNFVEQLAGIKHGTYTRIDSGERQAGASAQDWQKLLPEVVVTGADGILSLAYGNAALVSAVELAKDNVELRARIERLESLIEQLLNKE